MNIFFYKYTNNISKRLKDSSFSFTNNEKLLWPVTIPVPCECSMKAHLVLSKLHLLSCTTLSVHGSISINLEGWIYQNTLLNLNIKDTLAVLKLDRHSKIFTLTNEKKGKALSLCVVRLNWKQQEEIKKEGYLESVQFKIQFYFLHSSVRTVFIHHI